MQKKLNIAIVGATGTIGETMLTVLEERNFPVANLFPLASHRSINKTVTFKNQELSVLDVENFDFRQADLALFSAGNAVSKEFVPHATACGSIVIDNTSCYRYENDIPLVIPEINAEQIKYFERHNIIANPNCSTIQMLMALKPLHDVAKIKRINVATYQSVSGTGKRAIKELVTQLTNLLNGKQSESSVYPKQIAFNVIPQIDSFQENGYTREEMKMVWETKKILADENILINPTTVRVPVLYGHAEAINVEFDQPLSATKARAILKNAKGVKVVDDPIKSSYPTPMLAVGRDEVFVGRIRNDISHPSGLNLWVVADNTRKGAATNAIQIAEILLQKYLS